MSRADLVEQQLKFATGQIVSFESGKGKLKSGQETLEFLPENCDPALQERLRAWSSNQASLKTARLLHELIVTPANRQVRYVYNFAPPLGIDLAGALGQYLLSICKRYPARVRPDQVARMISLLSKSGLLNGRIVKQLIESDFGKTAKNLSRLSTALTPAQAEKLAIDLSLTHVSAEYCVKSAEWQKLATVIWGQSQVESLLSEKRREIEVEAEAARLRTAECERERAECERREIEVIENLRRFFRANPTGIRNERRLARVCLECGSKAEIGDFYRWGCSTCGADWYSNRCWQCKTSNVDDRDPETPACATCGWCECARCGACKRGCSSSFSRVTRYTNQVSENSEAIAPEDIPF